ncbi:MAG: SusD/RagB family nutrient-binding outer membrane lipoprotein [Bacteroidales bacterium]|nr:SusD/RagB family nutrient-binding outer membrane lipoprotein [Bacteroidales bacterium]
MKKITNTITAMAVSACALSSLTACDDYLDVNTNLDAPDYVDAYLYLASIEEAFADVYYDLRAAGPLTQMMGTSSYTSFANHYYSASSDAAGQMWRMTYWEHGMNLENLINQSIEAENWTLVGIGYAIKAFSWQLCTEWHGDMPMTEAFQTQQLSYSYDYQDAIYPQIREWALTAIKYLEMEDQSNYGTTISGNDYIYGADAAKWKKFAYATLVRNLASLTCKDNFVSDYYSDLVSYAEKAFQSNDDNATVTVGGGGADAALSAYNNFWGPYRGNLAGSYFPHEYAVQVFTGTVPQYNAAGEKILRNANEIDAETYANYPYELAEKQIICDTLEIAGHLDPRAIIKIGSRYYNDGDAAVLEEDSTTVWDKVRKCVYYGGSSTSVTGPIGTSSNFYGLTYSYYSSSYAGSGRWLYRDEAPYILLTYPEIQFDLAEAHFKAGNKSAALAAWKKAVEADMEFTATYITTGKFSDSGYHQGDWLSKSDFTTIANEYLAGPYVGQMSESDLTLSHIMMQKWVHLYPWGALEAFVDERKYFYDIDFSGEYPSNGNGWDLTVVNMKSDDDASKVYKGFYLYPANVTSRNTSYNDKNNGSPCFRVRPRYNSEYVWNKIYLDELLPISGMADDYHCSIPYFCYPNDATYKKLIGQ